ncbi:MAG: hypothetical protein C4617_03695 [Candidatus Liberibacter europaeus]|uniref:Secreted protein n=1 Tax=Candidatus Liberibacter europaeus TaxID=744859 RepID=A0A2T4VX15_9HYPH|nr:hypothetical protein [Candidatus Liberibacter europaeus]PTL86319.1 MAG: hypothetical protein C4617_03695 [Candidatus Liberibacter europaeus]
MNSKSKIAIAMIFSSMVIPNYAMAGGCCSVPKVDSPRGSEHHADLQNVVGSTDNVNQTEENRAVEPTPIQEEIHANIPPVVMERGETSVQPFDLESDTEYDTPSPIGTPVLEHPTIDIPTGDDFLRQNPEFIPSSSNSSSSGNFSHHTGDSYISDEN